MRAADWAALALLSVFWGSSFMFIGLALEDLPPLTIVAGRVGVVAVVLVAILYLTGLRLPTDWRSWRDFTVLGLLGQVVPVSLIAWG